jgi:HEAT repeat protein
LYITHVAVHEPSTYREPDRSDAIESTCSAGRKVAALRAAVVGLALAAGGAHVLTIEASQQAHVSPVSKLRPIALDHLRRLADRFDTGPLALERLARDGDADARRQLQTLAVKRRTPAAVAALMRLGDKSQVDVAKQLLSDRVLSDPVQLFSALDHVGATSAAPVLMPWLDAPEDDIASAAALALGRLAYLPAVPELRRVMAGANPLRRPAAAAALWRLGKRDVRSALDEALENFLPEVRLSAAAAWAPETNGPWSGVIRRLLDDPNPARRIAAARLLRTTDPGAVRRTMGVDMRSVEDPVLRSEAASVFELVATAADSSTLAESLEDPDATVQIHAAGAVLRLTGSAPGPTLR